MKKLFLLFLPLLAFANNPLKKLSDAELKALDLSGKYIGKRHQYTADKKAILQSFEYEFELKQVGNTITGVSTIIKENGDYADVKLRGTIVGDILYFEEYEIQSEVKNPDMVWCLKTGGLQIRKCEGQLKLVGNTNSYMADYFYPCTGGFTDLTKADNNATVISKGNITADVLSDAAGWLQVSPNPYVDNTKLSYTLPNETKVTLQIFDITGKLVTTLENEVQKPAGTYTVDFVGSRYGFAAGFFIAKLTAGNEVHSRELVQMR